MEKGNKRYYWLQLKEDFFRQKEIKLLRRIAGGDTHTIIYLKLMLLSLKNDGAILYEGVADSFAEEIALEIDEDIENVQLTLNYLISKNLMKFGDYDAFMQDVPSMIGSETDSARRMRKHREMKNKELEATSNEELELDAPTEKQQWETDFEDWWNLYNKKVGRKNAKNKFKKMHKKYGYDRIKNGTILYIKTITDKQYQKHPTTFLNGEIFNDAEGLKQMARDNNPNGVLTDEQRKQYEDIGF